MLLPREYKSLILTTSLLLAVRTVDCRLYVEEGLTLKRMKPAGKRKAARHREERLKATGPDQVWSVDFVADQLQDGTRFRSLTIVRCLYLRGGGNRSWTEHERRRCSTSVESSEARTRRSKGVVL
jgi:hypothetical protein